MYLLVGLGTYLLLALAFCINNKNHLSYVRYSFRCVDANRPTSGGVSSISRIEKYALRMKMIKLIRTMVCTLTCVCV